MTNYFTPCTCAQDNNVISIYYYLSHLLTLLCPVLSIVLLLTMFVHSQFASTYERVKYFRSRAVYTRPRVLDAQLRGFCKHTRVVACDLYCTCTCTRTNVYPLKKELIWYGMALYIVRHPGHIMYMNLVRLHATPKNLQIHNRSKLYMYTSRIY